MISTLVVRETEIYPTKVHRGTANERITGYAVQFEDSDECIECHSGTHEENRKNATRCAAADAMLAALEIQICPLCDHILGYHADQYGCEVERSDREGYEGEPAQAMGPCSCKGGNLPDIKAAIAAIRKARQS